MNSHRNKANKKMAPNNEISEEHDQNVVDDVVASKLGTNQVNGLVSTLYSSTLQFRECDEEKLDELVEVQRALAEKAFETLKKQEQNALFEIMKIHVSNGYYVCSVNKDILAAINGMYSTFVGSDQSKELQQMTKESAMHSSNGKVLYNDKKKRNKLVEVQRDVAKKTFENLNENEQHALMAIGEIHKATEDRIRSVNKDTKAAISGLYSTLVGEGKKSQRMTKVAEIQKKLADQAFEALKESGQNALMAIEEIHKTNRNCIHNVSKDAGEIMNELFGTSVVADKNTHQLAKEAKAQRKQKQKNGACADVTFENCAEQEVRKNPPMSLQRGGSSSFYGSTTVEIPTDQVIGLVNALQSICLQFRKSDEKALDNVVAVQKNLTEKTLETLTGTEQNVLTVNGDIHMATADGVRGVTKDTLESISGMFNTLFEARQNVQRMFMETIRAFAISSKNRKNQVDQSKSSNTWGSTPTSTNNGGQTTTKGALN